MGRCPKPHKGRKSPLDPLDCVLRGIVERPATHFVSVAWIKTEKSGKLEVELGCRPNPHKCAARVIQHGALPQTPKSVLRTFLKWRDFTRQTTPLQCAVAHVVLIGGLLAPDPPTRNSDHRRGRTACGPQRVIPATGQKAVYQVMGPGQSLADALNGPTAWRSTQCPGPSSRPRSCEASGSLLD
jgi:hypothetical protein